MRRRMFWTVWDASGVLSVLSLMGGVPVLAFWFPFWVVGTVGVLWWRYRCGAYMLR